MSESVKLFGDIRDDETQMMKVIAMLARARDRARKSPADFFTFVFREEHTQKQLKLAPHQKVMFDFVMHHDRCVIMIPVGHSKTFCMAALGLFLLGNDPTMRGVIVSATQEQAGKPLKMIRDYIEQSKELRFVFPNLKRSSQLGHPWTLTSLTVERPFGIKDPSLMAVGVDGAIAGSRLNFVLVDDILNRENTATPEQRAKVYEWFDSSVLSRLDPRGSRVIVTNTAWHSRDLVHDLMNMPPHPKTGQRRAWPTLKMATTGEIKILNSDFGCEGKPGADDVRDAWPVTSEGIETSEYHVRLTAHDPDPHNACPLFPQRYDLPAIEQARRDHNPIEFARAFLNETRLEEDALCKREWIRRCMVDGNGMTLAGEYRGPDAVFTGVDLAVSPSESADSTVFFTFRVLPDNRRLILDVECGRFNGPEIIRKISEKAKAFNSYVVVENNSAQDFIRQFALEDGIPVSEHTTGRNKAHPEYGVPGLFVELMNGGWIIPNRDGVCHPHVQRWIDECLEYSPAHHTGDALMACYFARERAKDFGYSWGNGRQTGATANVGLAIMSR